MCGNQVNPLYLGYQISKGCSCRCRCICCSPSPWKYHPTFVWLDQSAKWGFDKENPQGETHLLHTDRMPYCFCFIILTSWKVSFIWVWEKKQSCRYMVSWTLIRSHLSNLVILQRKAMMTLGLRHWYEFEYSYSVHIMFLGSISTGPFEESTGPIIRAVPLPCPILLQVLCIDYLYLMGSRYKHWIRSRTLQENGNFSQWGHCFQLPHHASSISSNDVN